MKSSSPEVLTKLSGSGFQDFKVNEEFLRLGYTLHSTLDLKDIFTQFHRGLQHVVKFDGIHYVNQEQEFDIKVGAYQDADFHELHYHLALPDCDLGMLTIQRCTRFEDPEISELENLLTLLLNPLQNALRYQNAVATALHDSLTGVLNRSSLESSLLREMKLAHRHDDDLTLLLLDLDHFKTINDKYGHNAGDAVLKHFADTLKQSARDSDLIFRFGGEEFLILLTKTDIQGAITLAERIRECTSHTPTIFQNESINATVSIGVVKLKESDSLESIIERADKKLYQAKSDGRNLVVH